MAGPRVVIIGAGPAGARCAEVLVAAGLRPIVLDESSDSGGQIYRRQPNTFARSYSKLYGTESDKAASIHADFDALFDAIDYRPDTVAWAVANDTVFAAQNDRAFELPFDALVLCTGATDRILPSEGWNLAGTYSLGAAQVALKAQACSIGHRVVFMGTGPLLYLVAAQYVAAGADVAGVLDTSTRWASIPALAKLLAKPGILWRGLGLERAIRKAGVPIYRGIRPVEIVGTADDGVQGVRFCDSNGRPHRLDGDAVALGYHLRSETQLADLAGCSFAFDPTSRQWLPQQDADGRATSSVYLAGDGARVLGADAAETSGRLAGLAVLEDHGYPIAASERSRLRKVNKRFERFAGGLARAFPWPQKHVRDLSDETIVCRCEAITVGELRSVARLQGAAEVNRAKAFSRVGMGRCQGRYCGLAAAEIIAEATGIDVQEVGRLRAQAPAKPLSITTSLDDA